ncbi:MAG: thioredoxin [Deltaproteobacteria bacterium]|nr:thioredoxin [Deltaproteobacteria bacterium]
MASADTIQFNDDDFDREVLKSETLVLVDFWAPWCGPCRALGPVVDQLAAQFRGKVRVGKVNIDDNHSTARRFGIKAVPTLMVFKDGKIVDQKVGSLPKGHIEEMVNRHLQ